MTESPSCTEYARSYHHSVEAGVDIENEDDIDVWSTEDYPFDNPPSAHNPVPPISYDSNTTHVDAFDQQIRLIPSLWVDTMTTCDCIYCGLHNDILEDIEEAFLDANSDQEWYETATQVLKRFRDWKYDSISHDAIEHEAAVVCTFDLENPIRGVTDEERNTLIAAISAHERQLVTAIRNLSIAVLLSYYDFPLTLYRGMGYHLQPVAEAIFTNPTQATYLHDDWDCAISNFTPDPEVGCHFSEVSLRVEANQEAILSAPDFLTHTVVYYHNEGVWRLVTEGEIRLATDELEGIHREDICVARAIDTPLPDAIETIPATIKEYDPSNMPLFSPNQHRAIREATLAFANFTIDDGEIAVESVSPPASTEAVLRIQTWFHIYEQEFPPEQGIDPKTDHVAEIVQEIITTARNE